MPIEFVCPHCARMLRTPDDSAGKKAKCPQCASIIDVPPGPTARAESPWGPAAGSSPFGAESGPPPAKPSPWSEADAANPYASPAAQVTFPRPDEAPDTSARPGLPWEAQAKSVAVFWNTSKLIIGSPTEAFALMRLAGGLTDPISYAVIGGAVGGLFAGLYNTLIQLGMLAFVQNAGANPPAPEVVATTWIQVIIQLPVALAGGTIGMLIGSFISAGIFHLCLMMLGGARQPFETTYRVVAYVNGATALVQVVPLCGQYAVGLMALIHTILGLANAHRIGGGKAAAAVLLPIAVCIVACGVLIFGALGVAFMAN